MKSLLNFGIIGTGIVATLGLAYGTYKYLTTPTPSEEKIIKAYSKFKDVLEMSNRGLDHIKDALEDPIDIDAATQNIDSFHKLNDTVLKTVNTALENHETIINTSMTGKVVVVVCGILLIVISSLR